MRLNDHNEFLDKTYTVQNRQVTVRHFENIARTMNLRWEGKIILNTNPLPLHGKMPALEKLLLGQYAHGYTHVGAFASHGSNWAQGIAPLAFRIGYQKVSIVYATNPNKPTYPDWLEHAQAYGAELIPIRPNMTAINSAQAKKILAERGAYFIPFGLETRPVIDYLTEAMSFPETVETLVMCCGSGITLTGVILHAQKYNKRIPKIVGVSSGRSAKEILKTVARYSAPIQYSQHVGALEIKEGYDYAQTLKETAPFSTHPYYERKAFDWLTQNIQTLHEPIHFLNMGVSISE